MTPAEIAAYIGAAAWLPQVGQWIYKAAMKPRLKMVSAPTVEVGYTTLGPIVNLTASISSEKRDSLITKITLKATHEKGEARNLTWKWLNETQHQIRTGTGETAEVSKNQPAIALKVSTLSLAEKLIGFQDLEYLLKSQEITSQVVEHFHFLKSQSEPVEALMNSKEVLKARDFFSNNMYWREGRYAFKVSIYEVQLKNPHRESFSVIFSKSDIERLRTNCTQLEPNIRALISSDLGKTEGIRWPQWNWVYPEITSIS